MCIRFSVTWQSSSSAQVLWPGGPQVQGPAGVGEILAGLIIGPCVLNLVQTSDAISTFAEIGVVMLMFTTGLVPI